MMPLIQQLSKMQEQDARQQILLDALDSQLIIKTTDKIYSQAYQYFKICNWVALLFAISKIISTPFILFNAPFSHFTFFLIALVISSALQLFFCYKTKKYSQNVHLYYAIAQQSGHIQYVAPNQLSTEMLNSQYRTQEVYDFTQIEATEDERKMKALAGEIKYSVHTITPFLADFNRIQFVFYQVVQGWGLILLLSFQFPNQNSQTFVQLVILLGIYQYFEFYIIVICFALILPFFIIRSVYGFLLSKYKTFKLQRALKSQIFTRNIKGDHQCKICLVEYEQNENIIILKCSEMHNFHSGCLREWAKTSSTCPLCRKDISSF